VNSQRKDRRRGSEEFQNDRFDLERYLVISVICFEKPKEEFSWRRSLSYHERINNHLL